ncbi:MAG: glycosyltransferase family 2 protein [Ruminococcaceae bacterium]|nr:glycosyltransferase family 2 protein [Oscillospiraceae bacterium]
MISVIIPIYNAEKYLLRTIHCLQEQLYTDFEVLLIDDGSKDNSAAVLRDIAAKDTRFRYIYQENQGVSAARNHGLELCKGQYVTFIDADDVIPNNYLANLLETLLENHCQMSVCDVVILRDEKESKRFSCTSNKLEQTEALNLILSRRNINSGPCAKLFQREILKGIQFPPLKAYEDILFVINAVCRCEDIAVTSDTQYNYIQNEGSAMNGFLKLPSKDIITATEKLLEFLRDRKDLDPQCFYVTTSHLMQYAAPLLKNNDEKARSFVKATRSVYKRNLRRIWTCVAFPWKEKITFTLFTFGWKH